MNPTIVQAQSDSISKLNILAIPVIPSDRVPERTMTDIRNTMTDIEDYIDEQSYGSTKVSIELGFWLPLEGTTDDYSNNETEPLNTQLAHDTIILLEAEYDLSFYDYVIVVFAGKSVYRSDSGIHTYRTAVPLSRIFSQPVKTVVVSEWSDSSSAIYLILSGLGASKLTWRDPWNWGIGSFCVMGGGDAGLCAYTKMKIGYLKQNHIYDYLNGTVRLRLTPLSYRLDDYCAVRYTVGNGIYFLIELRENTGRDALLSQHGILITKVNETALSLGFPGIEILLPRNTESFSQATLTTGESFHSSEDGIAVKVIVSSSDGASIVISDAPIQDWYSVNRMEIEECEGIRFLDIAYVNHSIFGENLWVALGIECDTYTYLSIHESKDYGRNWEELFNTKGFVNISNYNGKLAHYQGKPLFVAPMEQGGNWFTGICWYETYIESNYRVINLSSYCEARLIPYWELQVSSNEGHMYFLIQSQLNGSISMTFFSLSQEGWKNSTLPGLSFPETRMTNCRSDELPILFARNTSGIYKFQFNSSTLIKISDHLIWNLHCLNYNGEYLAYQREDGNQTSYVLSMVNSTTLIPLINQISYYPKVVDIGVWNNSISMIVHDANGTYIYSHRNGIERVWNIENVSIDIYRCAMLDVIPSKLVWTPFVTYNDGYLATFHYDFTTPETAITKVWSYSILDYDEYAFVASISLLFGSIVVGVVLLRYGNKKMEQYQSLLPCEFD